MILRRFLEGVRLCGAVDAEIALFAGCAEAEIFGDRMAGLRQAGSGGAILPLLTVEPSSCVIYGSAAQRCLAAM